MGSRREALNVLCDLIRGMAPAERLKAALGEFPQGTDLLVKDDLLRVSATSNNVEALEWLVDDLGASPRGVDAEGNTLLHLAVASRCSDIIAWMLDDYGGHGHVDLLLSSDSQGINPVVKAVRSRYAEGIDAMCHDKEGVWHRACRPSSISAEHQSWLMIPFAAAYDEAHDALQVSSGSETDDEQLQIISRKLGVMLRLGVMEWIHNVCLESYEKAARLRSAKEGAACWECCKSQIVEYLESTRWWQGFSEQAETLERYDVEEVYEAQMLKSAAMAGQAALVEWLLDTWKVDFYLAQTYDDSYAIADFVCCPALLRQRAERDAAERMSSDWESPVETWYNMFDQDAQTNGSLQLPDIQNLILVILASVDVLTESERVYSHAFIEERKKMLRLLGFDDSLDVAELQHSNAVRILRILIDRYNECAMPSLDLLVRHGRWRIFAWLKEEGMIDLNAPLAEPPARTCTGDGDPADGEVCAICLDPLPIPALCCTLGCNHVMCRKCVREHFCFSSDYHGSCAPCPLCRREVPPPRVGHGDFMLKLRGDLQSGATTWLFPDGLSPTEDITLGQVLLGLAVGCSSLQFLEGLVKLGLDPFLPIGGRSLAHVACEQKAPASLVWLLWMAKHKGRLDDLLHSCDRQGWRPLEAAVRAGWRFGTMFCLAQGCPPVIEGRQAWCDLGLASDSKNVRELATKFVSFDLVNGGIMENYLLSGCNLEMLVELVDWPECLRHLVRDYESKVLERVLGDRAGYQEDTALYTLVYNHIVRHGRVDVLRWLIFFGPSVLGLMTPPGRYPDRSGPYVGYFICRDEVRKVGERWGLDKSKLKAFDVIFDEADSLKKIHQELDVQHKAFHHLMCSGGSVAEAEACRARVAALVAQFPEGMERCSIIAEYSEMSRTALEDPVARPRNSWKSLCSAARYNHLALVKWLLEVKAARHPEGGWADSCFRAFVVSATHGAKDVAQATWKMLRSGSILDEAGEFHVSVERALADTCYGCNSMAKQYIKPNHNHGEQDDNALDDDGHSGSGSISIGVIISHAISRFFEAAAIPEWDERLGIGLTVWLDLVEWLCDQPEVRGHHQNILHNIELYPYVIFPKTYVRADAGMLFLGLLQLLVDKHGARLDVVPCYVWNGRRRKNRDRLTIGQILATAGDMMTDSLPWLVEEKGVNIQSLDSSTSFLRSSWGTETVTLFHRLLAEQKERFDLVDEVIENGLSSSLQDRVDVRRLTDRYGRPLLEAATREKRPREVLDSIAAAMEARVGNVPRS